MNKRDRKRFKKQLEELRVTLGQGLQQLSENNLNRSQRDSTGDLSGYSYHMADVGTDNFEHEFTLGLLESEQALLREIHEALARIEEGTFGICLGTGEYIPKARLRAKPWAKYTVEYTRLLEKGLVRPPEARAEEDELEDESEEESEE